AKTACQSSVGQILQLERVNPKNALTFLPTILETLVERILLPANTPVWTLDMSSEAAGVYFVQLNMNGVVATEKLIKVQ
ncbi:MAG: T9SS type A sorting domain-containing protein, partial [Flavobacteriales bacterium]